MSLTDSVPALVNSAHTPLIHRDLSWLQFNERVLEEARHPENPLLERVKFLAITSTNLDEFFMIRASSLERAMVTKRKKVDWGEYRSLLRIRTSILDAVAKFADRQADTLEIVSKQLQNAGVHIVLDPSSDEATFQLGQKIFEEQVLPKLTAPETFSFGKLHSLENLQSAVFLSEQIWLRIPRSLPSVFWSIQENGSKKITFFFLDDLIMTYLRPGSGSNPLGLVRLTRDGDFTYDVDHNDPESIPDVIRTRLGTREGGRPIRLQHRGRLSRDLLGRCASALKLSTQQLFNSHCTIYLHGLWQVVNRTDESIASSPDVRYPVLQSKVPVPFQSSDGAIFERIKKRDYLLHHPYDSFESYVHWVRAACADPQVESIEQTVYRIDSVSPIIGYMKEAAKTKKVRVLIELRARFDEQNNLRLADELQKAGVEVAFGFGKLKLHAKVALVTRNENGAKVLYTHLSTGNYNAATARQYTDLAILTANAEIGADARHFFDTLFLGQIPQSFKQLVIAPTRLARRLLSHIQEEAEAAKQGRPARIVAKVNALVDQGIIESLYIASQAGVQVDLIVRGACSLIPGIKGLSENIRVVSIVDRFLEHSRIYYFESSKRMYLSSADWMPRNFFSRLEIAFPVLDERIYAYLQKVVIPAYLSDTAKARELTHQGRWKKRNFRGKTPKMRSQVLFRELALHNYRGTPLEN